MTAKAPTDQRAGTRPISFVLRDVDHFPNPVILSIRPEELTRQQPTRASVHQTLGRNTEGWVDNFGLGLPSVTIRGHTGWRTSAGSGLDGAAAFEALNKLVMVDYHDAKQRAIDRGVDPGLVSLMFVDMLDSFTWSVVPMQFTLQRSKSRPLLFQYNIVMQAINTNVGFIPTWTQPNYGNPANAIARLDKSITTLNVAFPSLAALVRASLIGSGQSRTVAGEFGSAYSAYTAKVAGVLAVVSTAAKSTPTVSGQLLDDLVGTAASVVRAGQNVTRAVNAAAGSPASTQAALTEVASAMHEASCILAGALRPKRHYEEYSGLLGASNCSSTIGGHPESIYAGTNVFSLLADDAPILAVSGTSLGSVAALKGLDSVLAPMTFPEMTRNLVVAAQGIPV